MTDHVNNNYNAGNFINEGLNAEPNDDPNSCYNKYFFWTQTRWWQPYFDFTEDEIKTRVKAALKPTSGELVTTIRQKPDLYGPFWIMFTWAFALTSFGNVAKKIDTENWKYDFGFFPSAIGVVFGFWILAPLSFLACLKCFEQTINPSRAFEVFALYAYAHIWLIFGTVACLFPWWIVKLIILCLAGLLLSASLYSHFKGFLDDARSNSNWRYILIGVLFGWQALLVMVVYVVFF